MIAMQEKALMARISQRSAAAIRIHRDCRYLLQGFSKHSRLCPCRKLGIDAARFVRSRAKSNNAAAIRVKTACQTPSLGSASGTGTSWRRRGSGRSGPGEPTRRRRPGLPSTSPCGRPAGPPRWRWYRPWGHLLGRAG